MSKICSNCSSTMKENQNFCTQCGTKYEEKSYSQKNDYSHNSSKTDQNIKTYDKLGGFLILFAILLILGNMNLINTIAQFYDNNYVNTLNTFVKNENYVYLSVFNTIFYLLLIGTFTMILFTISFFLKSKNTKIIAIIYFVVNIGITLISFVIISKHEELMKEMTLEFLKSIFQLIFALIFLLYFSLSKRVKGTFTKEKNTILHIIVAFLIPFILFFTYNEKVERNTKTKVNYDNSKLSYDNNKNAQKKKEILNKEINSNSWSYKDWSTKTINNSIIEVATNSKYTLGNKLAIIKSKEHCNDEFLLLTLFYLDQKVIGLKELSFNVKVDNDLYKITLPILKKERVNQKFINVTLSSLASDLLISELRAGRNITFSIIKSEEYPHTLNSNTIEFSLSGFIANYNRANDICNDRPVTINNTNSVKDYSSDDNDYIKLKTNYKIIGNKAIITISAKNLVANGKGGISLSFPQFVTTKRIIKKENKGFNNINTYKKNIKIWNRVLKDTVRNPYLLAEGWSKSWQKNEEKIIQLTINIKQLSRLLINVRSNILTDNYEYTNPEKSSYYNEQGYYDKVFKIPLSKVNDGQLVECIEYNNYGYHHGSSYSFKLTDNNRTCNRSYSVSAERSSPEIASFSIKDECTNHIQNLEGINIFEKNDKLYNMTYAYSDAYYKLTNDVMDVGDKLIVKTNSKNIKIFCLEDMSICKTINEIKLHN